MAERTLFISHASEDGPAVQRIVDYLEREGITCWIAGRDIPPRAVYAEAITEGVKNASACGVIVSRAANASDAIKRELELASRHKRPFIPIRIEDVEPGPGLDYYLNNVQWMEYKRDGEAALDRIVAHMRGQAYVAPPKAERAQRGAANWVLIAVALVVLLGLTTAGAYYLGHSAQTAVTATSLESLSDVPEQRPTQQSGSVVEQGALRQQTSPTQVPQSPDPGPALAALARLSRSDFPDIAGGDIAQRIIGESSLSSLRAAAARGDVRAEYVLAAAYSSGTGVPRNLEECIRLMRAAANQGFAPAQADLGGMYSVGYGSIRQDDVEAARWLRLAADRGDPNGQNNLAVLYEAGRGGLPLDRTEAIRLYRLAAQQGHVGAQGYLNRLGETW